MKIYKTPALILCALFLAGCASLTGKIETPTETVRAMHEAAQKKDVEEIKKRLSKGTLKLFDETAVKEKTTVDELLKKEGGAPMQILPEMREEKIEGETATVEVKNQLTGGYENLPFVKEDGRWKLALDVYLEKMRQKFTEEMNKMQNSEKPATSASPESKK
jgi:PBP1b-binding outer membrane lipoprotein LpoB